MISFGLTPFAVISPSVHQMVSHAWELFVMNDVYAISMWSESPIEAWNKYIRVFKSGPVCQAQQTLFKISSETKNIYTRQHFYKTRNVRLFYPITLEASPYGEKAQGLVAGIRVMGLLRVEILKYLQSGRKTQCLLFNINIPG